MQSQHGATAQQLCEQTQKHLTLTPPMCHTPYLALALEMLTPLTSTPLLNIKLCTARPIYWPRFVLRRFLQMKKEDNILV